MKTYSFILIFSLQIAYSFAQIKFEQGYFIDNNDQKTSCLIKNYDWKNNPTKFEYQVGGTSHTGDITQVKEFGIIDYSKYIRAKVKIDTSIQAINNFSFTTRRQPEWSEQTVFLKVEVDGYASLYSYEKGNLRKFFFSLANRPIEQLVYKQFKRDNYISSNTYFHQQLINEVTCNSNQKNVVSHLRYALRSLSKHFKKYNECKGHVFKSFEKTKEAKKNLFNLYVTPGLNLGSLSVQNSIIPLEIDFESRLSFRLGLEAEYILPFNKGKWGLTIEPTYQSFTKQTPTNREDASIDYSTIEFPLGLRFYSFLNDHLSIFMNGFYIPSFVINPQTNELDYGRGIVLQQINETSSHQAAFGAGLKYKKFKVEARYHLRQNILVGYNFWSAKYNRLAIIFGYSIL